MTSGDVLTAEQFNAGIEGLKVYIDGRFANVDGRLELIGQQLTEQKGEIRALDYRVLVNTTRLEEVKNGMNWWLAALAIVVALVGVFGQKHSDDEHIRRLIREELDHRENA